MAGRGHNIHHGPIDQKFLDSVLGSDANDEIICIDKFIGDESMSELCRRVRMAGKDFKSKIVLRGNCLSPNGATSLANLLKNSASLQTLSVEWNQIASAGCIHIAHALHMNNSLLHLDLRNNGINDDGAIALANAVVEPNMTLKTLDLRWNQITDRGAEKFEKPITTRTLPLTVFLAGNNLTHKMMVLLEEWAKREPVEEEPVSFQPLSDELSLQEQLKRAMVENNMLKKEIALLRQQNGSLQTSITTFEGQLNAAALRTTELEQELLRARFTISQLQDTLAATRLRLSQMADDQKRLISAWELERVELAAERKTILAEKDAEIR